MLSDYFNLLLDVNLNELTLTQDGQKTIIAEGGGHMEKPQGRSQAEEEGRAVGKGG